MVDVGKGRHGFAPEAVLEEVGGLGDVVGYVAPNVDVLLDDRSTLALCPLP